ncbi:hypothetical protein PA598K_01014 [Paenibacillus sp. 598K]|uniref:YphA family membrane protein n=1 Tax=Paenibacillus sp. 598K TaxID=1117987 RepID=UPI000FFAE8FC|nr:hypothetical protein [Paenibacillus sp. 598K]GBF72748.1 hypothetical protein PA598K_01014 [Paenibacillus sp. 598K]
MNEGMIAIWAGTMLIILLATGWRRSLFGGMSTSRLAALAAGLFLTLPFHWRLADQLELHLSALWLVFWSVAALRSASAGRQPVVLLGGCLLLTAAWTTVEHMYRMDPVFVIVHPTWDAILLAGLFAGVISWRWEEQLFILALSLLAGQAVLAWSGVSPAMETVGGWGWWDRLLLTVPLARMTGSCSRRLWALRRRWPTRELQDSREQEGSGS